VPTSDVEGIGGLKKGISANLLGSKLRGRVSATLYTHQNGGGDGTKPEGAPNEKRVSGKSGMGEKSNWLGYCAPYNSRQRGEKDHDWENGRISVVSQDRRAKSLQTNGFTGMLGGRRKVLHELPGKRTGKEKKERGGAGTNFDSFSSIELHFENKMRMEKVPRGKEYEWELKKKKNGEMKNRYIPALEKP